jgi:hypothetical protein
VTPVGPSPPTHPVEATASTGPGVTDGWSWIFTQVSYRPDLTKTVYRFL